MRDGLRRAASWKDSDVPDRHRDNTAALDGSGPWAKYWERLIHRLGDGYLAAILGKNGTGKTQIGVEVVGGAIDKGRSARYVKAFDFFLRVRECFRGKDQTSERAIIREYANPDLLVIDEIGKSAETDFEDRALFHLIDKRYDGRKDTILISNRIESEFRALVGSSMISRMEESGGFIVCDWESFRGKN